MAREKSFVGEFVNYEKIVAKNVRKIIGVFTVLLLFESENVLNVLRIIVFFVHYGKLSELQVTDLKQSRKKMHLQLAPREKKLILMIAL